MIFDDFLGIVRIVRQCLGIAYETNIFVIVALFWSSNPAFE